MGVRWLGEQSFSSFVLYFLLYIMLFAVIRFTESLLFIR